MVIGQGNVKVWRRKSFKDVYQVRLGNIHIVVENAGTPALDR